MRCDVLARCQWANTSRAHYLSRLLISFISFSARQRIDSVSPLVVSRRKSAPAGAKWLRGSVIGCKQFFV